LNFLNPRLALNNSVAGKEGQRIAIESNGFVVLWSIFQGLIIGSRLIGKGYIIIKEMF